MTSSSFPRPIVDSITLQNALIDLDSIDFFLELSQVALLRDNALYLHYDGSKNQNDSHPSKQRVTYILEFSQIDMSKITTVLRFIQT